MFNLSGFTKSFLKATNGTVNGIPRIHNVDRGLDVYGYAEINTQATSSFSRIKVHKGWFACDPSEIQNGDLIEDRADNSNYFVMSVKNEVNAGSSVYLDGTLYYCNSTATISRFGSDSARDSFGRLAVDGPTVVHTNVPIMTNPKNSEILELPDRFVETDKIQVYVQAKFDVHESDRIITEQGDIYKVETIDKNSLTNIWICKVNVDTR